MYYDLNVPYTANASLLQRKLLFLHELGYNALALSHALSPDSKTSKLPADLSCPIPSTLPFPLPAQVQILRRLTLTLTDHTQNYRFKELNDRALGWDLIAVRPTDEATLQKACLNLECDLVSLDLGLRYPFHFQYKMFSAAISRGVTVELCYGPGILGSSEQRRLLIQNATALIRVTRGRGLLVSSECRDILACRGPADVANLAAVWGLGQERGVEAVTTVARKCVVNAALKRTSYRGVVDVVYAGEKPMKKTSGDEQGKQVKGKEEKEGKKRKFVEMNVVEEGQKPLSNRAKKRMAKEARAKQAAETSQEENGAVLEAQESTGPELAAEKAAGGGVET